MDEQERRAKKAAYMREWNKRDGLAQKRAKERSKRYAAEHPEQQAAYKRAWYELNKKQAKASAKAWKERNPEKLKEGKRQRYLRRKANGEWRTEHLRNRYGITPEFAMALWISQEKRCGICKSELDEMDYRRVHIDHDHAVNRVRGILCIACNHGLARFRDDPTLLIAAIEYLRRPPGYEI